MTSEVPLLAAARLIQPRGSFIPSRTRARKSAGIARRANSWPLFYQMTIIDSPREGTPRITISK
ncbi:MAG: hypothetical protein ACKOBZ_05690 [Nitrospira sp.]